MCKQHAICGLVGWTTMCMVKVYERCILDLISLSEVSQIFSTTVIFEMSASKSTFSAKSPQLVARFVPLALESR